MPTTSSLLMWRARSQSASDVPSWAEPIETALRGGVRPLVEDLVHVTGGDDGREVRMELASLAADDAVLGEGALEVRVLGEVVPRVDVVVASGDDVRVPAIGAPHQVGDGHGSARAALHRNAAAFAEVLLHINNDQCTVHGDPFPRRNPLPVWSLPPSVGRRSTRPYSPDRDAVGEWVQLRVEHLAETQAPGTPPGCPPSGAPDRSAGFGTVRPRKSNSTGPPQPQTSLSVGARALTGVLAGT